MLRPGRSRAPSDVRGAGLPDVPSDVADSAALFAELSDTTVMGAAEARAYVGNSLQRLQRTIGLLPALPPDAEVLELGANPYFLSRLLRRRGIVAQAANWFGDAWPADVRSQVVVESGTPHQYDFDHFNVERDEFPYADGAFDLVLFCEVLEHLPHDPVHALREAHRVLRTGGYLLLTTPNAARWDNLLRALDGDNTYDTLSGYGIYGRHNREYTKGELVDLVRGCGYDVVSAVDCDVGARQRSGAVPRHARRGDRGEQLLLLARATGRSPWYYPNWLYDGRPGLYRHVMADLVVGMNCWVQSQGLHDIEDIEGRPGRWTAREARMLLSGERASDGVRVEGVAPSPRAAPSLSVSVAYDGHREDWSVPCDGRPFEVSSTRTVPSGVFELVLSVSPTWSPAAVFGTADGRELGFVLRSVRVSDGHRAGGGSDAQGR